MLIETLPILRGSTPLSPPARGAYAPLCVRYGVGSHTVEYGVAKSAGALG